MADLLIPISAKKVWFYYLAKTVTPLFTVKNEKFTIHLSINFTANQTSTHFERKICEGRFLFTVENIPINYKL